MKRALFGFAILLSLTISQTSFGAIEVDNSTFGFENSLESLTISNFAFSSGSNRTLVVTVGGERTDSIASLTFGGVDMILAAINHTGQTHASVWYLDIGDTGAGVTGDIELNWSGTNNGFFLGAIGLTGVQSGGPIATDNDGKDSPANTTLTLAYPATSPGAFIVESAAANGGNPGITPPTGGFNVLYDTIQSGGGGYTAAAGYVPDLTGGAVSNTWQFENISSPHRVRAAGAMFTAAVPEPSTYVILSGLALCFGVCGWRQSRRKS